MSHVALPQLSPITFPAVCCHKSMEGSSAITTPLFYYIYDRDRNCRAHCGIEEQAAQRRYNKTSPSHSAETSGLPPVHSSLREERCQISKGKNPWEKLLGCFFGFFFFTFALRGREKDALSCSARGWSQLYINSQRDAACGLRSDRSASN